MSIEAGVLLDQYGRAIYWHLPEERALLAIFPTAAPSGM
jgi:hypothetical protein